MTTIGVSPEDLMAAAASFLQARDDLQGIFAGLEDTMTELAKRWEGVARQGFYRDFVEWQAGAHSLELVLANVADELAALAERFAREDR